MSDSTLRPNIKLTNMKNLSHESKLNKKYSPFHNFLLLFSVHRIKVGIDETGCTVFRKLMHAILVFTNLSGT